MPKNARPRGRAALAAVALVPRQHAAPASGSETPSVLPRSSSGRAGVGGRARIAVLAFLLGFAACYAVLRFSGDPETFPPARAMPPAAERSAPAR
jgi:hypothetical protein